MPVVSRVSTAVSPHVHSLQSFMLKFNERRECTSGEMRTPCASKFVFVCVSNHHVLAFLMSSRLDRPRGIHSV